MASEKGGSDAGETAVGTLQRVRDGYAGLQEFNGEYLPRIIAVFEVVLGLGLFVGFLYWLYLFQVVGT